MKLILLSNRANPENSDNQIGCDSTKARKAEESKPPQPGHEVVKPTKVQLIREMVALSGALFCKAEALYALHRYDHEFALVHPPFVQLPNSKL